MEAIHYPKTLQWVGTMTCPSCQQATWAWRSSGLSQCCPHFYCDRCSNVIVRESDQLLSWNVPASMEIVQRIAASLPAYPCGGRFTPGADPKCPVCATPFKHPADIVKRLSDPNMIVLDGACAFGDRRAPYQVKID